MSHLTREQILARKLGKGVVTLDDGTTVAIRAMTMKEVLAMQQLDAEIDRNLFILTTAMTSPKLSLEDATAWSESGDAGDLNRITNEVAVLSKLRTGDPKEVTKSVSE